jgi:RNA polymerase sigma factor (TIGR02999 family)
VPKKFRADVKSTPNTGIIDSYMANGGQEPATVRQLMADLRSGDRAAVDQLIERFYPELRRMAAARMIREPSGHTWQPTALINELYMELARVHALPAGSGDAETEKAQFLGLAGFLMKRLLIHHARPLYRQAHRVAIPEGLDDARPGAEALNEIENLLDCLARIDPVLRQVVEMKVFEGLSREEIAERLHCSVRTASRHWEFARHWLGDALAGPEKQ